MLDQAKGKTVMCDAAVHMLGSATHNPQAIAIQQHCAPRYEWMVWQQRIAMGWADLARDRKICQGIPKGCHRCFFR